MPSFDRPPAGPTRSGRPRAIGLDVARAVAMIGVVAMNYHGMINFSGWSAHPTSFIDRVFDIRTGVLSTRFAAMFVVVAGIGVTLLTEHARSTGTPAVVLDTRLRLLRRGATLLIGGYLLDLAWPGTILFYYGAYFLLAACIFRFRTRTLMVVTALASIGAVCVSIWRRQRLLDGDPTSWISPPQIASAQDLLARMFLGYTHPVLPWFAFFMIGMILGRHLDDVRIHARKLVAGLIVTVVAAYAFATVIRSSDVLERAVPYIVSSMHPDERGVAYIVSTPAIAVLGILAVFTFAERHPSHRLVVALQRAGQLSLSMYLGHVLFYYVVFEWVGWAPGSGLGSALLLAATYWVLAITIGSWWHHRIGSGPAERVYRLLGG